MNYWYIWYEIYEDGKLIPNSKGRYMTAYQHKSSAVRRAKQMWSKDLYNPMTDTYIHRKWIVSQVDPWDDVYVFKTWKAAMNTIADLRRVASWYGCALRADLIDLIGDEHRCNFLDLKYGWTEQMLKDALIEPRCCGESTYIVEFPRALPIY